MVPWWLNSMNALSSHEQASEQEARKALREFLALIYEIDGPNELRRMYECFYVQAHQEFPPHDFADRTGDGTLNAGPGVKAATNGL